MTLKKVCLLIILALILITVSKCAAPANPDMPVVLITDLGTNDFRVPRLKGVIYDTYPDARVIDATHGISSFDIAAGAYVVGLTAREFPEKFVFVTVVGSRSTAEEKLLVLVNNKDQIFIAPDNGLLTYIISDMGVKKVYEIANQELFDEPIEALSYHYVLGKAGAMIASGYNPSDVGPEVSNPVLLDIQEGGIVNGRLVGSVVFIDHFGNCLTNISGETLSSYGLNIGDTVEIIVAGNTINAKYGENYSDVLKSQPVILVSSLGTVQLSINMGSFAGTYDLDTGSNVELER